MIKRINIICIVPSFFKSKFLFNEGQFMKWEKSCVISKDGERLISKLYEEFPVQHISRDQFPTPF